MPKKEQKGEGPRDNFSPTTRELLARRAGYRCSICKTPTVGPHTNPGLAIFLGEASHICAAASGGPRANSLLTEEQRSAASNGIHLCKEHARLIDVDVAAYPVGKLQTVKASHEAEIRSLIAKDDGDFDPEFLTGHETQVVHGRGAPSLADLWVKRVVIQQLTGKSIIKRDAEEVVATETGILLISGEDSSGRTSLLKRISAKAEGRRNCVWLKGGELTESVIKDPVRKLASGYRVINRNGEAGWDKFLKAPPEENLIVVDDLHRSSLNIATKRKLLSLLQGLASVVVVTVSSTFLLEFLTVTSYDGLRISNWKLLDLQREDCVEIANKWTKFESETVEDHELDKRLASTQDQLEIIFGRKLIPRYPLYVLTTLQLIDAGSAVENQVGSFGGVYDTIIQLALSKNAQNQAEITSERSYLQELAFYGEVHPEMLKREEFNAWFAEHKEISVKRVSELEAKVMAKGFLVRRHHGFRFHYQRHYFLATFLRDNPNRGGVKEYIAKLVSHCWDEDFTNTALFLAYLQPSSSLTEELLAEVQRLFVDQQELDFSKWEIPTPFPAGFFRGMEFSTNPEENRRRLAARLDESAPLDSSECDNVSTVHESDGNKHRSDYLKAFHAIKLLGQLIRNSPIAFDGTQKFNLIQAGFNLSLRLASFSEVLLSPAILQSQALSALRSRVLEETDKSRIESALIGMIYNLSVFLVFTPIRHACYYLAHPDLTLTYRRVLQPTTSSALAASLKMLECGLGFELRAPDGELLRKTFRELTPAGQDTLRVWASFFLSFNLVPVPKRQAILESLDMGNATQLLLPRG